jgi:S-DNA-T family DNA segregation ATPase FtsK/SpoIIIE
VLGSDWLGKVFVDDLTTLPHLLVAGSTGSGKSVFMRSILATIVHKMNNIKLVLSDTKGVEFNDFIGSPSLIYGERAMSPLRTVEHMDNLCKETDQRLEAIGNLGARNIQKYNSRFDGNASMRMPYIILAIDELADIVDLANEKGRARKIGAEKLDYLTRKARAAGIHVIASTQRPSVDVVKGVVKSNFIARLSFRMPSGIDSRVVLDEEGAEHLMKQGDMLYKSPNFPGLLRLHSGLATSSDIKSVLEYSVFKQLNG